MFNIAQLSDRCLQTPGQTARVLNFLVEALESVKQAHLLGMGETTLECGLPDKAAEFLEAVLQRHRRRSEEPYGCTTLWLICARIENVLNPRHADRFRRQIW